MASIRIDDLTTRRLSDFKGKKSYTVIINEMMDFFNNTGMRVTDNIASPIIVTQQESAKLQKIIRAIETKQNTLLRDILEKANFLVRESQQEKPALHRPSDEEDYMDVEEGQQLMAEYQKMQANVAEKDNDIRKLRLECERLKKELEDRPEQNTEPSINLKVISECLDKLCEKKQSKMFDEGKYTIGKADFNMCIDTIREQIKK